MLHTCQTMSTRAGEHKGRMGPGLVSPRGTRGGRTAGAHEGHMGPRTGGSYQHLVPPMVSPKLLSSRKIWV